jgi:F-type H+-transporting ATPase subunit epsilon
VHSHEHTFNHHNGIRVESCRSHVRSPAITVPEHRYSSQQLTLNSYNRYIAVASRVVRRSLKEDKRIAAERRGESELRFAKWEVSAHELELRRLHTGWRLMGIQNGKQGELKELNAAALQAQAEAAKPSS